MNDYDDYSIKLNDHAIDNLVEKNGKLIRENESLKFENNALQERIKALADEKNDLIISLDSYIDQLLGFLNEAREVNEIGGAGSRKKVRKLLEEINGIRSLIDRLVSEARI